MDTFKRSPRAVPGLRGGFRLDLARILRAVRIKPCLHWSLQAQRTFYKNPGHTRTQRKKTHTAEGTSKTRTALVAVACLDEGGNVRDGADDHEHDAEAQ